MFEEWHCEDSKVDSEIISMLLQTQEYVLERTDDDKLMLDFFPDDAGYTDYWGVNFLNSQFIAELYAESEGAMKLILFESRDVFENVIHKIKLVKTGEITPFDANNFKRIVADRTIRTYCAELRNGPPDYVRLGVLNDIGGASCFLRPGDNII